MVEVKVAGWIWLSHKIHLSIGERSKNGSVPPSSSLAWRLKPWIGTFATALSTDLVASTLTPAMPIRMEFCIKLYVYYYYYRKRNLSKRTEHMSLFRSFRFISPFQAIHTESHPNSFVRFSHLWILVHWCGCKRERLRTESQSACCRIYLTMAEYVCVCVCFKCGRLSLRNCNNNKVVFISQCVLSRAVGSLCFSFFVINNVEFYWISVANENIASNRNIIKILAI